MPFWVEEVAWVELLAGLGADGVRVRRGRRGEARAWATAIQMESRVRGSELIMPSSESDPAGGGVRVAGEDADGVGGC